MSVLIEGMEMPKSCYVCPFCDYVSARCDAVKGNPYTQESRYEKRDDFCPLVTVPEPHGDLIDREELQHIIGQFSLNWEYGQGVSDCWDALLNAPTVIPASGK